MRFLLGSCLFLAAMLLALQVGAQSQSERDRARELGREGLRLFDAGRWQDAYDKLREADRLHHAPTLVLFMARSRRNAGELLEARALYESLVKEKLPADAPEQFRSAKDDAYGELTALRERIPTLLVTLSSDVDEASVRVAIDGRDRGTAPLRAPLPLDPGEHSVVARAADGREARARVRLDERDRERLELRFEDAAAAPDDEPAPERETEGSLVPAAVLYATGGVALALGIVTGVMTIDRAEDIKSRCVDNHCPPADEELGNEAEILAITSTVGFAVAGAALAAGVVLTVVRPGAGSSEVSVRLGPGALWLGGRL